MILWLLLSMSVAQAAAPTPQTLVTQTMVDFVRKESTDVIKWRDAVIVVKDGDHFAIDDVVFDADTASTDTGRLSHSFQGCRGRHWVAEDSR